MTITRPRNLLLLSVAALALLSTPLLTHAQDAATATAAADIVEEDATDLGDVVGDAMADITEGMEEEEVEDLDAVASVESSESEEEVAEAAADETTTAATTTAEESATESNTAEEQTQQQQPRDEEEVQPTPPPAQTGPFIDLFGEVLLSLEMVDETHAQVHQHYTNEVLSGKKVVGLYFSADW